MEHESFKITKVDLYEFLSVLTNLYNRGVNYVDIVASTDPEQDSIGVGFIKEYLDSPEELDNFDVELEKPKSIKLSDEDLNQLL